MPTRRATLAAVAAACAPLAGCSRSRTSSDPGKCDPTSAAFDDGEAIPARYTCDGTGVSPPVSLDAPAGAATWALVVTDPDAPNGTFTHWLLWNVPADADLPSGVPHGRTVASLDGAQQGENGFGDYGYGGPCPPAGDDPHTYRFDAYAVGGALDVDADITRDALVDAIYDADLVTGGTLRATYERA
ncbi:UPF0098 protein MTH_273 [Halarchaeum acidiphilum MH1-52-1]|uniref:UPF0098 protein MTH_273 n=2 Tax=Halarchaeum acidiphilum TaxID=489138 RepID=U2YFK9_9EURY|nr:YbhB/YbcL family Raf kinase inhibitor-like protein [Halarchaeum acidiphilum]GAD52831.1 UPF0098 protein MTH_273 [Halarchaeum acidiphilum MH1-52-1]